MRLAYLLHSVREGGASVADIELRNRAQVHARS